MIVCMMKFPHVFQINGIYLYKNVSTVTINSVDMPRVRPNITIFVHIVRRRFCTMRLLSRSAWIWRIFGWKQLIMWANDRYIPKMIPGITPAMVRTIIARLNTMYVTRTDTRVCFVFSRIVSRLGRRLVCMISLAVCSIIVIIMTENTVKRNILMPKLTPCSMVMCTISPVCISFSRLWSVPKIYEILYV